MRRSAAAFAEATGYKQGSDASRRNLCRIAPVSMISGVSRRSSSGLRVAIVGAGLMGYWHGRAAHYLNAQLVAIFDPDAKRANFLARKLRIGVVAEDLSDILKRGVDAV